MMRLPKFTYRTPESVAEVARILNEEGDGAKVVAGGTDLYPNMKWRVERPRTVVSLRRVESLRGIDWQPDGSLRIGPGQTLRSLERDERIAGELPGLHQALASISTPLLRNMGTLGGNLCLDTRCNYYNQSWEWRRSIDFCLKCEGEICWVAPSSPVCWAVNSSDCVPMMVALGATLRFASVAGVREVAAADLYAGEDGRKWMTKRPEEVMTDILIPAQGGARTVYRKLRRRGTFDFPVLSVAARIVMDGEVTAASLVIGAVGPVPVRVERAEEILLGSTLDDETIEQAAALAQKAATPLDNTDFAFPWRRQMVPVFVRRALREIR
jgi:4-hydroxybenzoyl-CoA reductase subunit beta